MRMLCVALGAAALLGAARTAAAQTPAKAEFTAALMPATGERFTARMTGASSSGRVFGFFDVFGPHAAWQNTYGELHIKGTGNRAYQAELNAGLDGPATARLGARWQRGSDARNASLKVMPLTLTTGGVQPELQLGSYASTQHGRWYGEHWADYTLHRGEKSSILSEATLGFKVARRLATQAQTAYNVNAPGWSFRLGGRYRF